ncbi:PIG-L family deacetylase [Actinospica sp. MGRD01-02]|uniref:PIG-L family deacetylase n=1 Tax=Actinospica acidithermotolerans TaxID=2828514 RepID=A0A941EAZ7_9ACTN|nr:PIG-L deacetylase family protein [Actinospica acidithermotolerans]MBR7828226.1 PIG-L family deacetylase [Actinospica acidithermotolerans]
MVAHPDDETFGLGAVISHLVGQGTRVHVLCFTHGEASTLGEGGDLSTVREKELRDAARALGVRSVTMLEFADGHLAQAPVTDPVVEVTREVAAHRPDALLVFDESGVTGHLDHQAATRAAVLADTGLPILAWGLPSVVADTLRGETGAPFAGRSPEQFDICVRVRRTMQRRAALAHASQVSPTAVFWRRLQLQGECEHLRWLKAPGTHDPVSAPR